MNDVDNRGLITDPQRGHMGAGGFSTRRLTVNQPGHGAFYHSKAAGAMVIVSTSRVALDQSPQQNISKIFAVLRQWGCGITL